MSKYTELPVSAKDAIGSGEKFYFTGKQCKHGHLDKRRASTGVCMTCKKIESNGAANKLRRKKYRAEKKEEYRANKREYYRKNSEKERKRDRERYIKNRDKKVAYQKKYTEENREKVLKSKRLSHKKKMDSSEIYRLSKRIRGLIHSALKGAKSSKTEEIIGCTVEGFKAHIERQFTKGMSWDSFSKIHIDHIIPLSSAKSADELIQLNHHTNLRPVWAEENLRKSSRMEFLI